MGGVDIVARLAGTEGPRVRVSVPVSAGLRSWSYHGRSLGETLQNRAARRLPRAQQQGAVIINPTYIATDAARWIEDAALEEQASFTMCVAVRVPAGTDLSSASGRWKCGWFDNGAQIQGAGIFPAGPTTMRASLSYETSPGVYQSTVLTLSSYAAGSPPEIPSDLEAWRIFTLRARNGAGGGAWFQDHTATSNNTAQALTNNPRAPSVGRPFNMGHAPNTPNGPMHSAGFFLQDFLNDSDLAQQIGAFRGFLTNYRSLPV